MNGTFLANSVCYAIPGQILSALDRTGYRILCGTALNGARGRSSRN